MQRRHFLRTLLMPPAVVTAASVAGGLLWGRAVAGKPQPQRIGRLHKTAQQWQLLLDRQRYAVLFEEATEPSGSSPLNAEKRAGTFVCAACHLPLFASSAKYESGTGWPSFFQPLKEICLGTKTDYRMIIPRTEYHCARCGGHQGHVFRDGPMPTGLRYCNNGLALRFVPADQPLPDLRT